MRQSYSQIKPMLQNYCGSNPVAARSTTAFAVGSPESGKIAGGSMDSDHVQLYLTQYDHATLNEEDYARALCKLDISSQERARRFWSRADAWS